MGLSWRRDFEIVSHLNINGMGSLRKLELNDMISGAVDAVLFLNARLLLLPKILYLMHEVTRGWFDG